MLNVGITGHRAGALERRDLAALRERIRETMTLAAETAERVRWTAPGNFSPVPTEFRLVSAIADGADQIAAEVALNLGWSLRLILPFDRATYRTSLEDEEGRQRFDTLVERAASIIELPGLSPQDEQSYVMAGRAIVAHSDLLIALWDGHAPRGRGGTGEVVNLALAKGVAVAHLPTDLTAPGRLLWSAFDPHVLTLGENVDVARSLDRAHLEIALAGMLLPPVDAEERSFVAQFYAERLPRFRARIEYPAMLALAGVRRFGATDIREALTEKRVAGEWNAFRDACAIQHEMNLPMTQLAQAYAWADRLATHFAQTYRSGHIFGFVLGAAAVCVGLSAFMAPPLKFEFAAAELVITLAVILNAWVGTRNQWHRRWLDYRQLAERLRPMRSLKLLAIAAPDPPGSATNPVPRRWIDFYAGAVWRAIGTPTGKIDPTRAQAIALSINDHEIVPQIAYHRKNAKQIEMLDYRLDRAGMLLFVATLIVSVATMVGMARNAVWVNDYGDWLSLISSGFPALGTALFGIRFQGDFGGDAIRSLQTAALLERIDEEIRRGVSLSRAADLIEQAGRIMLADLDEWRLVNQQRELEMG